MLDNGPWNATGRRKLISIDDDAPAREELMMPDIKTQKQTMTVDATAIQSTINAAAAAGGGTVEIPSAGTLSTYLSGPIVLSNNMNLKIDSGAMLQMLTQSNWPGTTTFISGTTLHDVEISGLGTIDGQGTNWWFPLASSRPNFISGLRTPGFSTTRKLKPSPRDCGPC